MKINTPMWYDVLIQEMSGHGLRIDRIEYIPMWVLTSVSISMDDTTVTAIASAHSRILSPLSSFCSLYFSYLRWAQADPDHNNDMRCNARFRTSLIRQLMFVCVFGRAPDCEYVQSVDVDIRLWNRKCLRMGDGSSDDCMHAQFGTNTDETLLHNIIRRLIFHFKVNKLSCGYVCVSVHGRRREGGARRILYT